MARHILGVLVLLCYSQLEIVNGFPQQGKWTLSLNSSAVGQYNGVAKNLYRGTKVFIRVNCHPSEHSSNDNTITIGWILRETQVIFRN